MTKELLWVGVLSLLLWCYHGQENRPQANAAPAGKPSVAGTQSADPEVPASPGQERPSALSERREHGRPGPQKATRSSSASSPKSAFHAKSELRPFLFSLPPATGGLAGQKASRDLPPPPIPLPPVANTAPNLRFGHEPCEVGTATYESAKPSRVQSLMRKIPGLRGQRYSDGDKGFVPPRPLREIRFMLPQGSSPGVMETKRMDLKASVDSSGAVTQVELMAPLEEELVTLASYAANEWRFAAAQVNDKAVASEVILHFQFGGNRP
jgi:hypothetical protein